VSEIRVVGLSFGFGKKSILDRVTFTVPEGGAFLLLGPSGGGKTTLLRLIAGFLRPGEGEIYLGERCVSSSSRVVPPWERGIGMVFQSLALWPHMSAAAHLRFAGGRRTDIKGLLRAVGLREEARRRPSALSGGQKQRLAIARAAAGAGSLLLLDEPFRNLDPLNRSEMNELLETIWRERKRTLLLVTHNVSEVKIPLSGAFLLEEGKISGPKPLAELLESSGSPYARSVTALLP